MIQHTFADDKYTVRVSDNGEQPYVFEALRHGATWRNLTGDGLILAMLQDYDDLKKSHDKLKETLNALLETHHPSKVWRGTETEGGTMDSSTGELAQFSDYEDFHEDIETVVKSA